MKKFIFIMCFLLGMVGTGFSTGIIYLKVTIPIGSSVSSAVSMANSYYGALPTVSTHTENLTSYSYEDGKGIMTLYAYKGVILAIQWMRASDSDIVDSYRSICSQFDNNLLEGRMYNGEPELKVWLDMYGNIKDYPGTENIPYYLIQKDYHFVVIWKSPSGLITKHELDGNPDTGVIYSMMLITRKEQYTILMEELGE